MEIFNLYESLMSEADVSGKAEACVKAFGNKLFGPQLGWAENNTEYESKILTDIINFTQSTHGGRIAIDNPKFIGEMNTLKSCLSIYPEVLHPTGEYAYRGIRLSLQKAIEFNTKIHGKPISKYPYHAKTYIESWTEDKTVAKQFGSTTFDYRLMEDIKADIAGLTVGAFGDPITHRKVIIRLANELKNTFPTIGFVIAHKATPSTFLFKARYFRRLSRFDHEYEIIRLGKEPLICEWESTGTDNFQILINYIKKFSNELNEFK